jgi:hypothetical protein
LTVFFNGLIMPFVLSERSDLLSKFVKAIL